MTCLLGLGILSAGLLGLRESGAPSAANALARVAEGDSTSGFMLLMPCGVFLLLAGLLLVRDAGRN